MSDNPFSTRYIRPGAIEFLFEHGDQAAHLVETLRAASWHGEIVGPHGAGKSTLLATLLPRLAAAGREIISASLHDGERSLPPQLRDARDWSVSSQVVVDGYEQLSWFSRWKLRRRIALHGSGLLVTSHRPCGLPALATLTPTLADAMAVVERLLAGREKTIDQAEIAAAFAANHGDLRETLFDLYDLYERSDR